jgi:hypothetical protein
MRAHLATHRERDFHLVECPLEISRRNRANNGTAFVALDTRVLSRDDAHQAAVTVRCSEIRMSEDWSGFGLLFFELHDSRISRRHVWASSASAYYGGCTRTAACSTSRTSATRTPGRHCRLGARRRARERHHGLGRKRQVIDLKPWLGIAPLHCSGEEPIHRRQRPPAPPRPRPPAHRGQTPAALNPKPPGLRGSVTGRERQSGR